MRALVKEKLKETDILDFMSGLFTMAMSSLSVEKNNIDITTLKKETNEK